jgi:hypothetical protein
LRFEQCAQADEKNLRRLVLHHAVDAGLNTLPGNEEHAWGQVTRTDYNGGCTTFGNLFGARQVGGRLNLSIYGGDTVLDCTLEYLKQTP